VIRSYKTNMADLDSKLLGETNVNYASDSDDEDDKAVNNPTNETGYQEVVNGPKTGPKGVLADYRRFKENKKIEDEEALRHKIAVHKKYAFTADPDKHADATDDFDDDDEFLRQYHEKRLAQMKREIEAKVNHDLPKYTECFSLSGSELLDTIENENRKVIVVVHLYDANLKSCKQMNKCFDCLAQQYPYVKFCKVLASSAGLSLKFKAKALPTIQVYKEGVLIGNFIKMMDKLDNEFYAADVENFLIDSDILTSGTNFVDDLVDSDCELD